MSVPNVYEIFKMKIEEVVEKEKEGTRKREYVEVRRLFEGEVDKILNFVKRVLDDPHLDIREELWRFLNNDIKAETE